MCSGTESIDVFLTFIWFSGTACVSCIGSFQIKAGETKEVRSSLPALAELFHALCCCLQCTQAAHHLQEARTLTGQKIPHSSFSFSKADKSYLQQDVNGCYNAEWRCCRSLTSKPRPNCKSPCKHTLVVLLPAKELLSPP